MSYHIIYIYIVLFGPVKPELGVIPSGQENNSGAEHLNFPGRELNRFVRYKLERRCWRARGGCVIHRCQNKNPRLKVDQWMWMISFTGSACGGFWGFWKSQLVESCLGWRRLTFVSSPRPCVGCARGLGQMEKSGVSLSWCRKTFKLKGNKKFCTWTKKSSSVFRVSGFLCSMYICYEHYMYVSHISVSWVCYKSWVSIN